MDIDVDTLRTGIVRIAGKLETSHGELTELDGKLGDGDLGITLLKAFRELQAVEGQFPADLGQAFAASARAVAKVSSSSFGTLLATGLIAMAKQTDQRTTVPWSALSGHLDAVIAALMKRGKANLGDKTVLDALEAVARAIEGLDDPAAQLAAARAATNRALEAFRDKPNKIGRARIFAEKSVGLDDPGMRAVDFMLASLGRDADGGIQAG
jgi:dihydroxyacetone kinase-like protein